MRQNNVKINPDTHIYLYAKGWYKKTNNLKDLKIIIGHRCALYPEHVTQNDIEIILLDMMYEYLVKWASEYTFRDFVLSCVRDGIIDACLSYMSIIEVKYIENLGEPDYSILPSSNS